jgi:glycosyltransferase involved in cell wall biosynthesis
LRLFEFVLLIRHFSTDDINGGAAKAAFRLHTALVEAGHRSQMFVRRKTSDNDDVIQLPPVFLSSWRCQFIRLKNHIPGLKPRKVETDYTFNLDRATGVDLRPIFESSPSPNSVICLHWTNGLLDSLSIRRIYERLRCPIVWVIHDLEPFTGGCHYSFGCDGFTRQCGACPRLESKDPRDHSHQTWLRKRELLSDLPICFVAPTSWGERRARESSLFRHARVERIPLPIDTRLFRPFDQRAAREALRLPHDKKIILFGATYLEDRRKGMNHLIESLNKLSSLIEERRALNRIKRDDILLLVVGLNGKNLMKRLPFPGRYLGFVSDELMMALAYQSADIFVCPSLEDSGPMMIPEAMLCGTPVAAFDSAGAPDLVKTMETGYLAANADTNDLTQGIYALLTRDSPEAMRIAARDAATKKHTPASVAARHAELYQSLIASYAIR